MLSSGAASIIWKIILFHTVDQLHAGGVNLGGQIAAGGGGGFGVDLAGAELGEGRVAFGL